MLCLLKLSCLAITAVASPPTTAPASTTSIHSWEYIAYPYLPMPSADALVPSLRISNRKQDGLAIVLTYSIPEAEIERRPEWSPIEKVTVRMHLPDGKIVEPKPPNNHGLRLSGYGRVETQIYAYFFPWVGNVMEEAWVELHLPGQLYWVEIPYGFTRDPAEATLPTDARYGPPSFAPAMEEMGPKDRIVPWLHVHYDLGTIQNGWGMSVNLANPFDAQAEVVLYRHDTEIGKSIYLWELRSPRTAVEIEQNGRVLNSRGMSIRLHQDGLRRSDDFKFDRYGGSDKGRDWGTVRISVDDRKYECIVPSSLFKYVHGISDPHNPAIVPRWEWRPFHDD